MKDKERCKRCDKKKELYYNKFCSGCFKHIIGSRIKKALRGKIKKGIKIYIKEKECCLIFKRLLTIPVRFVDDRYGADISLSEKTGEEIYLKFLSEFGSSKFGLPLYDPKEICIFRYLTDKELDLYCGLLKIERSKRRYDKDLDSMRSIINRYSSKDDEIKHSLIRSVDEIIKAVMD